MHQNRATAHATRIARCATTHTPSRNNAHRIDAQRDAHVLTRNAHAAIMTSMNHSLHSIGTRTGALQSQGITLHTDHSVTMHCHRCGQTWEYTGTRPHTELADMYIAHMTRCADFERIDCACLEVTAR
jgi:hypothetical protein